MGLLRKNERGDTIVEVLICVSILGFVIASAYSLATRNQIATLKAQERARATGMVESQIESLRTYIGAGKDIASLADTFCFVGDDAEDLKIKPIEFDSGNQPKPDRALDQATIYKAECVTDNLYRVSVWKPATAQDAAIGASDDNNNTYAVTVRWETAGGGSFDEVKSFYTIFPEATP